MNAQDSQNASRELADSILDAFPSGSYALSGLLRLLDIVATDRVPTAAVECRVQPRLLINPDFVARHADTSEKLLMLVMHELHHVLLGHTTLFPRLTPAQNFVFDAVINGVICRMFPDPAYTAFLTGFYRDDRFPECLLRPPPRWPRGAFARSEGLTGLPEPLRSRALDIHAALYSEGGASYHEVYELLPKLLESGKDTGEDGEAADTGVPLLGGHDAAESEHQELEHISPLVFDLVRELVEQWPQPPDPIRGRSLADVLRQGTVAPSRPPSRRAVLRGLIRKIAGERAGGRVLQTGAAPIRVQSPVPTLSRRATVLSALGVPTLLHETQTPWRRRHRVGERVHVYLDVSGSMDGVLGALYGAALDCEDLLHPQIHLFSTQVTDITPAQLRAGTCKTTGGTSIDVVAEHMAGHRVRRALVVTDGWVGRPAGAHRQTLQDTRLAVAFLGNSINTQDLSEVADHTAVIGSGEHT